MSTLKTQKNDASVDDFINSVENEERRNDSSAVLELFKKVTGEQPKMWGASIIGFGQYHYKSERSSQEGDWPLVAFSPRKQSLTLYLMLGFSGYTDLLAKLGKHKTSKGCLYITHLSDVDQNVLEALVKKSYENTKETRSNQ